MKYIDLRMEEKFKLTENQKLMMINHSPSLSSDDEMTHKLYPQKAHQRVLSAYNEI